MACKLIDESDLINKIRMERGDDFTEGFLAGINLAATLKPEAIEEKPRNQDGMGKAVSSSKLRYVSVDYLNKKAYFHIGDESVEIDDYSLLARKDSTAQLEIKLTIPDVNMSRFEIAAS